MNIAINGFGRIAKNFLRHIMYDPISQQKICVKTINIGPGNPEHVALLFKYDTIMGQYAGSVELLGNKLIIDGYEIEIIAELDPANIDWKKRDINWVVDCTGKFTDRRDAEKHIRSGAHAVLISAPAENEDISIIMGVNESNFIHEKHQIVSLGSCTTNALLPMLKILNEECCFDSGFALTTHAYTNSQVLLDVDKKDPRRARAAALNIIPTSTGASLMVSKVIPELSDRIEVMSQRVPVGNVSFLSIFFTARKVLTVDMINTFFTEASTRSLKGILDVTKDPLVSSDFMGSHYSVTIDRLQTSLKAKMYSVSGWYDNEWGYSARMKDFLIFSMQ